MNVETQREEFIQRAMKTGQCAFDRCDKCGSLYHGFYNLMECTFKCLVCAAEEKYPDTPKLDTPKLDYEDFIRI